MEYRFRFSAEHANIILGALLELPAKMSYDVIGEFRRQASAQEIAASTQDAPTQADTLSGKQQT